MRHLFCLVCSLLLSCMAYGEKITFAGQLIYGGQSIESLSLSDGQWKILEVYPDLSVDEVSEINEHQVLVSAYLFSKNISELFIYDLASNTLIPFRPGSRGIYIPKHHKIVFYHRGKLLISDMNGSPESLEVIDTAANAYPMSVVPISADVFLYESERSGTHGIWQHDMVLGEAVELPNLKYCSLSHAIWRVNTQQLLCSELSESESHYTGRYVFTDLNGENKQFIDFGEGEFWPVIYLAHLDAVVLQERAASLFKGEYHPVYIYQFADSTKTKVDENNMLNRRVAYLADKNG